MRYSELELSVPFPESCSECPFRPEEAGGTGVCGKTNAFIDELYLRGKIDETSMASENTAEMTHEDIVVESARTRLFIWQDILERSGIVIKRLNDPDRPRPYVQDIIRVCLEPLASQLEPKVAKRVTGLGMLYQYSRSIVPSESQQPQRLN